MAKARQDEMKQMVRLMQQGHAAAPAHQQATVDFARRFAKGIWDKAKGDYVDGGQSTGDFSLVIGATLLIPSVIARILIRLYFFRQSASSNLLPPRVEAAFYESEAAS